MRVTLISHNAQAGDAIGNQIAARAAFFRERGAKVHVLVESDRRLHQSLSSFTRVVADPAGVVDDLRRCDLIIVDYGRFYPLLDVLPQVSGKGPRILFDYHGVTPPELWDGPAEVLREGQRKRGLVWYADQAVVHSRFMRDELCGATGYPAKRVHILPLWFEAGTASSDRRVRERLGLADERVLLFVGRLAANKRVPMLIEALALLKDERPAIHAVIVGDGTGSYRREMDRCRSIAAERGIAERVHFLGHVSDADLADAYRSADVFVMPSLHEGCCVTLLEAMAAGVPVVAARAAALPETIAGAGLSFARDDAADLAKQLRRVLTAQASPLGEPPASAGGVSMASESLPLGAALTSPGSRRRLVLRARRIALVAPRYGIDVLGGAERSLRLIAEALAARGHSVEVFTTGRGDEVINGIRVHRFAPDPVDESALAAATQAIRRNPIAPDAAREFVRQTRQSIALLEAFAARCDEFDACIVGPYANGLTWAALRVRPERTILVPCFHREPLAQQPMLAAAFAECGGLLYHSAAEQRLAEIELGVHHPNSTIIGTWLAPGRGDAERGRRLAGGDPYLLYAGRYCREKNTPMMLDWLKHYMADQPGRFWLVLIGGGSISPPDRLGWKNLGYVSETDRADLIAGAAALVQLSTNESLSLAALEAWNEGTPVIAHAGCDVLGEMLNECHSGAAVAEYEQFHAALNQLWDDPETWRDRGRRFVRERFGSREAFTDRIEDALHGLDRPLADIMRERGLALAAERTPADWQRAFAERVDAVLHADPIDPRAAPTAEPLSADLEARLADAAALAELPDGYEDISEGRLARWKGAVKRKLLHQFQESYVDVLSRQQTEMNRVLLETIRELAERVEQLECRLDDSFSREGSFATQARSGRKAPLAAKQAEDMEVPS